MAAIILVPDALERLAAARPILQRGSWGGGTGSLCLVAALVPGARNFGDCATWPDWMPMLCATLYDAKTGAPDEQAAADRWGRRLAAVLAVPVEYERARQRVLIGMLGTIASRDDSGISGKARRLLQRQLLGETVGAELEITKGMACAAATPTWGSIGLSTIPQSRAERNGRQPAAWTAAAAAASAIAGAVCGTAAAAADFGVRLNGSDRDWKVARRGQREILIRALSRERRTVAGGCS